MTAYIIVAARVDKRTEGFIEYSKRAGELTTRCGGEYIVRGPAETVLEGVNAEVNFPNCAEVKIPTFLDMSDHSELLRRGGRPRRFFGLTGAVMGGSRKFSGTSLACSLSR